MIKESKISRKELIISFIIHLSILYAITLIIPSLILAIVIFIILIFVVKPKVIKYFTELEPLKPMD